MNVLRQQVKVIVNVDDEKEIREYPLDQLRFKKRHGRNKKNDVSEKELKELEKLEKQDEKYLMEVKGCTLEIDGIGYFRMHPANGQSGICMN